MKRIRNRRWTQIHADEMTAKDSGSIGREWTGINANRN